MLLLCCYSLGTVSRNGGDVVMLLSRNGGDVATVLLLSRNGGDVTVSERW